MTRLRWLTVWLLLLGAMVAWTSLRLRDEQAVRSDLLALLPRDPQDAPTQAAVEHLAHSGGNRAFLLVVAPSQPEAVSATEQAVASLGASGAFAKVIAKVPAPQAQSMLAFFRQAGTSLMPIEPAPSLTRRFLARSYGAFSTTGTLSLADDPFGFASDHLKAIPWPQASLRWQDGYLITKAEEAIAILLILELRPDSADYSRQVAVALAVDKAEHAIRARHPAATLRRMGGLFYAEAAQTGARHDTELIGLGSALGVMLLMLLFFRSLAMLATGLVSVASGVVAGSAAVLMVFGEIHLITLVFGVSLIGEAADYSIQLVSARLADEEAGRTDWLSRMLPGLGMALGTSLLGYAAMTLVPLPSIRQIAVFAFAGLATAFVTVVLIGPPTTELLRGGTVSPRFGRLAEAVRVLSAQLGRKAIWAGVLAVIAGLVLTQYIRTDDDVRSLIHRPPGLVAQEEMVSKSLGAGLSPQFILLHPAAGTDEACLRAAETVRPRLDACRKSGLLAGWTSLADITPSAARQHDSVAAYRAALGKEHTKLADAFTEIGFTPQSDFWKTSDQPLRLDDFLAISESLPFRHLRFIHDGKPCHLITLRDVTDADRVRRILAGLPDVTFVDKASSISLLLGDVRRQGVLWLGVAFLLALAVLSSRYGGRRASLLLLPTAIGVAWAPVLAATVGVPFSVFGLMALLLILGVGVNYSIFLWEGGARSKSALAGVLASCLTTLLSFGLLAFCSMPALSWLGTTLGLGILVSFLLTPLALAGVRPTPDPA